MWITLVVCYFWWMLWLSLYWWQDFDWEKKWKLGQPKEVALPISRSKLDLEAQEIPSIKRWDSWKDQQNKISKTRSGCNVYHCRGTGQEMLGNKVSMITVRAIVAEESHQGTWFDPNAPNEAEKLSGSSLNIKDTVNLKSEMEDSKNLGLSRLQMIAMWCWCTRKDGWRESHGYNDAANEDKLSSSATEKPQVDTCTQGNPWSPSRGGLI